MVGKGDEAAEAGGGMLKEKLSDVFILFKCRKSGEAAVTDMLLPATIDFSRILERLSVAFGAEAARFRYWNPEQGVEVCVEDDGGMRTCSRSVVDACDRDNLSEGLVDISVEFGRGAGRERVSIAKEYAGRTSGREYQERKAEARQKRIDAISKLFDDAASLPGAGKGRAVRAEDLWAREFPLHAASESRAGDALETVKSFLERGGLGLASDAVNERDSLGRTPMHYAACRGRVTLCECLVTHGANANAQDLRGEAPLHRAAAGGFAQVVRALALANGDVNSRAASGASPLMLACKGGHVDAVSALVRHGAAVGAIDMEGCSALDYAAADVPVLRGILQAAGAEGGGGTGQGPPTAIKDAGGGLEAMQRGLAERLRRLVDKMEGIDLLWVEGHASEARVRRELERVAEGISNAERGTAAVVKLQALTLRL